MPRKPILSRAELERAIRIEGMSVNEFARRTGVTRVSVYRRMREFGIPRSRGWRAPPIQKELLERLYLEANLTREEVADLLGTSLHRVRKSIRTHGIYKLDSAVAPHPIEAVARVRVGERSPLLTSPVFTGVFPSPMPEDRTISIPLRRTS